MPVDNQAQHAKSSQHVESSQHAESAQDLMDPSSLEHKTELPVEPEVWKLPEIDQERGPRLYERLLAFREFETEFPPHRNTFAEFVDVTIPILAAQKLQFVATIANHVTRRKAVIQLYGDKDNWKKVCNAYEKVLKEDRWKDFLDLDIIINAPADNQKDSLPSHEEDPSTTATVQSWSYPYKGKAHLLLWNHISSHYRKNVGLRHYANVCPVVQSSGMGKSRAVDELGKEHFLIPLCLWVGRGGYPPPDVLGRCCALLIGLFDHTYTMLVHECEKQATASYADITEWFHNIMSPDDRHTSTARVKFYQSVIEIAKTKIVPIAHQATTPPTKSGSHKAPKEELPRQAMVNDLVTSIRKLVEFLRSRKPAQKTTSMSTKKAKKDSDDIDIIIAFDEAHVLDKVKGVKDDGNNGSAHWTAFTTLRDVFRTILNEPVRKLSQSSPIHNTDSSRRIRAETLRTVPPYTDLAYDLFARHVEWGEDGNLELCPESDVDSPGSESDLNTKKRKHEENVVLDLETVTDVKFMVRFGRPLFPLRYMKSDEETKDGIVRFAMQKLINCDPGQLKLSSEMTFACLSQRLRLEFSSTSYVQRPDEMTPLEQQEKQIEAHMRVLIRIGEDNQNTISTSGSEPILAEAAAIFMMADSFKPTESLKKVLEGFAINKGDRGELVALLAVTVARDEAVRNNILTSTEISEKQSNLMTIGRLFTENEEDMKMLRAMKVVDFMSSLFALEKEWEKELKTDFANPGKSKQDSKSCAFLHFNHFIKPHVQSTCNAKHFLLYMTRGAGLLCANCMPAIDFLLPALFGTLLTTCWLTYILGQVKNDESLTRERDADYLFECMNATVARLFGEGSPHPVIRIIFSFGSASELHYTKRSFKHGDKTYVAHDFWCGGIGDHLRPTKKDGPESWRALTKTTMRWKELYKDADNKYVPIRMSLYPGGAEELGFWPWVE